MDRKLPIYHQALPDVSEDLREDRFQEVSLEGIEPSGSFEALSSNDRMSQSGRSLPVAQKLI
jgi:hypothetical protein